jgi:hypothetical protein
LGNRCGVEQDECFYQSKCNHGYDDQDQGILMRGYASPLFWMMTETTDLWYPLQAKESGSDCPTPLLG